MSGLVSENAVVMEPSFPVSNSHAVACAHAVMILLRHGRPVYSAQRLLIAWPQQPPRRELIGFLR